MSELSDAMEKRYASLREMLEAERGEIRDPAAPWLDPGPPPSPKVQQLQAALAREVEARATAEADVQSLRRAMQEEMSAHHCWRVLAEVRESHLNARPVRTVKEYPPAGVSLWTFAAAVAAAFAAGAGAVVYWMVRL